MNDNLMEVVCIIDESGSMSDLRDDTIGGFNAYLETLKELEKDVKLTLVTFSDVYKTVIDGLNVKSIKKLTKKDYSPNGNTALLDAVGSTMIKVGRRLADTPEQERPGKVSFFIATDGQENASREFSIEKIKDMVKEQTEKYSWDFVFAGANIDAFGAGSSMNVNAANIANYTADSVGTRSLYLSAAIRTKGMAVGEELMSFAETYASVDEKNRKKVDNSTP